MPSEMLDQPIGAEKRPLLSRFKVPFHARSSTLGTPRADRPTRASLARWLSDCVDPGAHVVVTLSTYEPS